MMKIKRLHLTTTLLLFCLFQLNAQQEEKIIQFSQNERISQVNTSGKYVGVMLFDKGERKHRGILYDTLGNGIFEVEAGTDTSHLKNIMPNERNDQAVVITKHLKGRHSQWIKDEIISYSIPDKKIQWKATMLGGLYKISPDGRYLLTIIDGYQSDPDLDSGHNLGVLNLDNGQLLPIQNEYHKFRADWFDEERIIIYTWDAELVKNEQFAKKMEDYSKGVDSISKEKFKLYRDYEASKIDSQQYEKRVNQFNEAQTKFMRQKRKGLAQVGRPLITRIKDPRLIRYNVETNRVEYERVLEPEGTIDFPIRRIDIGKYVGNNTQGIYLKSLKDLYKLDSNFNILWKTNLYYRDVDGFYYIKGYKGMYFVFKDRNTNKYYRIGNNGKRNELTSNNNPVFRSKMVQFYPKVIDLTLPFQFDKKNNRIHFRNNVNMYGQSSQSFIIKEFKLMPSSITEKDSIQFIIHYKAIGKEIHPFNPPETEFTIDKNSISITSYIFIGTDLVLYIESGSIDTSSFITNFIDTVNIGKLTAGEYILDHKLFDVGKILNFNDTTLNFVVNDSTSLTDDAYNMGESEINIYPNPCTKRLYVHFNDSEIKNDILIDLISMKGEVVEQKYFRSRKGIIEINMHRNLQGIYLLKIRDGNNFITKQLIIN